MQLVILAAGFGRRFGGLKQLAPVGPNGEAIMDYTAQAALSCGYAGVVLVVREEIRDEISSHVRKRWPGELPVDYAIQGPVAGTAQAVVSAAPFVTGVFGVANADDLYGDPALAALRAYFEPDGDPLPEARDHHLLVAYHLVHTVLTDAPVTRGLCEVDAADNLISISEHHVALREDGRFDAEPLVAASETPPRVLDGSEWVSMNLWGFHPGMLGHLAQAVDTFDPASAGRRELLLPEVVGRLVTAGTERVHVVETDERCIGVTHAEDIPLVFEELTVAPSRPRLNPFGRRSQRSRPGA